MSRLYDEIHEQPQVIDRLIRDEQDSVAQIAGELRKRPIRHILIAARGTSDNAATYGKYLFGNVLRLPVALAAPSLYTIYHTPRRSLEWRSRQEITASAHATGGGEDAGPA
jgi:glucosamine--fructose-6-phosphate aminotransferase (isomerizing)